MSSEIEAPVIEIVDIVVDPPAGMTCEFCNNPPAHCLIGRLNAVDMCAPCFADLVQACAGYKLKDATQQEK